MEYKNFTAGYFDGEINFCIENLQRKFIENIPLSLFLTEKIFLRGSPTRPSSYLRSKLND